MSVVPESDGGSRRFLLALRLAWLCLLIWGFLVAIGLLESAIRVFGQDSAGGLFEGVTHPLAALSVGVLATVLLQSSSIVTASIVVLCGAGQLDMSIAVPMVMGANIGTTITSSLVSLGSVRRSVEFRRAYACASLHDAYNIVSVIALLPLELATGFLQKTAVWLAERLSALGSGGDAYQSPIRAVVKAGTDGVTRWLEGLGAQGTVLGLCLLGLSLGLIFFCLLRITKTMRLLLVTRIEAALNEVLRRSGFLAILVGVLITVAVQSSSITTSLLVPLCAAGILRLENAYPITLGANIGTTTTALMASLVAEGELGLAIALVHLLYNLSSGLVFFPIPMLRRIPIRIARRLALMAVASKLLMLLYLVTVFVLLPIAGILVFR